MRAPWACTLVLCGCLGGGEEPLGPAKCAPPAGLAGATGCAFLFGTVTSVRGEALDGIEGSIRPAASCSCPPVTVQVDERGLFSATVYRVAGGSSSDTGRVTVVMQATAPKYPRHVTGAPYFDTVAVLVRFAPNGSAPELQELRLRIPLP